MKVKEETTAEAVDAGGAKSTMTEAVGSEDAGDDQLSPPPNEFTEEELEEMTIMDLVRCGDATQSACSVI